jgi:cyclophilin family peptidyl-prolyl cis-trans isomerase
MIQRLLLLLAALTSSLSAQADNPRVWMDTDRGPILLELNPERAPRHVENFLAYVNEGFYDGLIFHRSIEDFVVQGGGYDREFRQRQPTLDPIPARLSSSSTWLAMISWMPSSLFSVG